MTFTKMPKKQGLYSPEFEHDACGMGFVSHIKGKKSHQIVEQALEVLVNLRHRGASGSEENTGDGAGILIQLPDSFLRHKMETTDIVLPNEGNYGVGMVFLPPQKDKREKVKKIVESVIESEGQQLLGWREVPVNSTEIGKSALEVMPHFSQIFIEKSKEVEQGIDFERKLYLIRKKIENKMRNSEHQGELYFASLSSRTLVYKGMLTPGQLEGFFPDLTEPDLKTAIALVHSRFSTNTFPSWERAHPNRYLIHNGEINTMLGNQNWMRAREGIFESDLFSDDLKELLPVIAPEGSDSARFDNVLEFLALTGRSLAHSIMMMIPEPWEHNQQMEKKKRDFYHYHSTLMEAWDGPAAMAFTDGSQVGAVLDRNGLRPSRYYITKDDLLILSSEVGVLELPEAEVISKQRLEPGKMLLLDTEKGRIINDKEIKTDIAAAEPYGDWLDQNLIELKDLKSDLSNKQAEGEKENLKIKDLQSPKLVTMQKSFGYSYENLQKILIPMARDGVDPIGSMGNDAALAVLSDQPQLLYNYFKQRFAQVTNPPIDSIREKLITATNTFIGSEGNLLQPNSKSCRQLELEHPLLKNKELDHIKNMDQPGFKTAVLDIVFNKTEETGTLSARMEELFAEAEKLIANGVNIIILSDRSVNSSKIAIPALLAVSGLHHYLIKKSLRTKVSLILESGEPREVHHFSALIGYGLDAVNPYLAYATVEQLVEAGHLKSTKEQAVQKYIKAAVKGVVKVMAKMGISTVQSYRGAQIFEAIGISESVIDKYFCRTASRIGGIGIDEIEKESIMRHDSAYKGIKVEKETLDAGGNFSWRKDEEEHLYDPETIYLLQRAVRENNYELFKEYSSKLNDQSSKMLTLRGLLEPKYQQEAIPLEEVEPAENIMKRFKTGAMSYGSISQEAHEALAIAMNRIGGKSNTGEGGENPDRFTPDANGDLRSSAIKQVASGRFGVNSHYLVNAKEIQIKMAQGAKPGEGGQLPGKKVYPWIAETRGTTPGVGLISPPPHHDIYSIEDLAQLIHDLKNANREARINVKLVSEVGVGTVAAGVAKGKADVILISGYDGGTGASPRTSIRHAGLPWELGLSETHQTLVLNDLRDRVTLETDGKIMTGKDLAVAAMLGAEEFGFATTPLVALGCVMMRVCSKNTCPVGVATQDPELRKKFQGKPEHVVNFMRFIAEDFRRELAALGFSSVNELVGRIDKLRQDKSREHWKAKGLDYSSILYQPKIARNKAVYCQQKQEHGLEKSLDFRELLELTKEAVENGAQLQKDLKIKNTDRVVGTILGSEITKRYGAEGLPEDTIQLNFEGSAGQSFAAYLPQGVSFRLKGDSNDYLGKGLSGAKIIVEKAVESKFRAEENIIIGNVAFFGATAGKAYIEGKAGERFCVRNSGVEAVVEGLGDHGCEYMTGGKVVVLGQVGRNFAAGMTGGTAYVFDLESDFKDRVNGEMVELNYLTETEDEIMVKKMIQEHLKYTGSDRAAEILNNWQSYKSKFIRVMPCDYQRMIKAINNFKAQGLSKNDALMKAFEENAQNKARVSGN
ncbi:Glutamate synthase [NADPH] large chain [Halanaerobium saccharolyticum subsp. saccharolyticum DSM 6643]|uniref:Glutamate synthase [NADPH] large chain n=1 Tax=Halanaerobium saccharolyticum subsp. saccharolyticum DSM 6643 TaxID=1293054 RepID=M5DZ15_9FIRM|nr:glutamate synthase large subunit [Halanaerobium saccharolyticum]CCU78527.1 Glutamate synthase [NADPH] large chain [Halanaerobium saccharolyticum subsp. saccharolyticum DSM 6643]